MHFPRFVLITAKCTNVFRPWNENRLWRFVPDSFNSVLIGSLRSLARYNLRWRLPWPIRCLTRPCLINVNRLSFIIREFVIPWIIPVINTAAVFALVRKSLGYVYPFVFLLVFIDDSSNVLHVLIFDHLYTCYRSSYEISVYSNV